MTAALGLMILVCVVMFALRSIASDNRTNCQSDDASRHEVSVASAFLFVNDLRRVVVVMIVNRMVVITGLSQKVYFSVFAFSICSVEAFVSVFG